MTFTDPPYGVAIGSKNKELSNVCGKCDGRITEDINNDTLDFDDLQDMLADAIKNLVDNSDDSASYYVTAPQGGDMIRTMEVMRDAGLLERRLDGDESDMDEGAFSRWRSTGSTWPRSSGRSSGRARCWCPTACAAAGRPTAPSPSASA